MARTQHAPRGRVGPGTEILRESAWLFTHHAERNAGPRLGAARFHLCNRRCICRSPQALGLPSSRACWRRSAIGSPFSHSLTGGTKRFPRFGEPSLGWWVTSGNIDSMVAHYTAAKRRSDDAYSPRRKGGLRPDRAVIVYSRILSELYPDRPILLGGLEASLRRFAHYDYWDDAVLPSILVDARADLLIYGMGERSVGDRPPSGREGQPAPSCGYPRHLLRPSHQRLHPLDAVSCRSFEQVCASKREYAAA